MVVVVVEDEEDEEDEEEVAATLHASNGNTRLDSLVVATFTLFTPARPYPLMTRSTKAYTFSCLDLNLVAMIFVFEACLREAKPQAPICTWNVDHGDRSSRRSRSVATLPSPHKTKG